MQKVIKCSKRILSVVLALVLALAYLPMFSIESEAAATSYKWRVTVYVNKGTKHTSAGNVTIYWKTANGTSSSSSMQLYSGSGSGAIWQNDGNTATYVSDSSISGTVVSGVPANAFPYKATATITMKKTTTISKLQWKVKIEVLDSNNNVLTDSEYGVQEEHTTGVANGNTYTATDEIGTDYYPYITSCTASGVPDAVYIPESGSTSYNYTISAVDQYGVEWVNDPSLQVWGASLNSTSTKKPTVTYSDVLVGGDTKSTIQATYTTANSQNGTQNFWPVNELPVYVSRNLTFDNLFDYAAYRRKGSLVVSALQGTISDITLNSFKLTCNSDALEVTTIFGAQFGVTGGSTLGVSADVEVSNNTTAEIYFQWLDSNGEHISYASVRRTSSGVFIGSLSIPSNATSAKIRFDCDVPSGSTGTVKYANVRVYQHDGVQENITVPTPGISVMANKMFADYTASVPTRFGYTFDGWYVNLDKEYLCYDSTGKWVMAGFEILKINEYMTSFYVTPFYSKWTPEEYTVTFVDANGNTFATDTYTIEDTSITIPPSNPTKTGYTFSHWVVDTAAGNWTAGATVTSGISAKYGNVKVKPVFKANKYSVTFNSNGGSAVSDINEYTIEQTLTLPVPTKTGYRFAGWAVESTTGNWSGTYTSSTASSMYGNVSLKAVWTAETYTITFDANGGNAVSAKTYTIEDTVTLPTPTRTGYTFAGWIAKEAVGNWPANTVLPGSGTGVWGNVTLVAQWTPTKHEIIFIDWDGEVLKQSNVDYDSTPTPPENPERPADNWYTYEFSAWNPVIETVTGAATYKAEYTATLIPYTITLDAGEGSVASTTIINYDGSTTSLTLPDAVRAGYTFTGWIVKTTVGSWTADSVVKGELALNNKAYGNVTLVADYTANNYTVNYNPNGGALKDASDNKFTATFDSVVSSLNQNLERTGYTFAGWNTKPDGTGDDIFVGETVWTYTDVTEIYAKWTPKTYTINFSIFDITNRKFDQIGTIPEAITYTVEDDLSKMLPHPEIEGYDFNYYMVKVGTSEWGTTGQIYELSDLSTGRYGDVTLAIAYTIKEYTVTFINDDDTVLATQKVQHGKTPIYNGTPTKAPTQMYSYVFAGWDNEIVPATGDATYKATYTENEREYTVKFVDDEGNIISEKAYKYGAAVEVPADPSKESTEEFNYAFSYWKDAQGNKVDSIPNVTADVIYTADFTATTREYTISWVVDGATITTTVKYGELPNYPNGTPAKDKTAEYTYTFDGWSPAITKVTGEATYTAQFKADKNSYTVTFVDYDGTQLDKQSLLYGETPVYAGDTPVREMDEQYIYTFSGWDPEIDEVTGDATYTAVYSTELRKYTITFVDEDGTTVLQSGEWDYGSTPVFSAENPTKAATAKYTYTFDGWTTAISSVNGAATYTAKYHAAVNKYTITFVDEDGTELQSAEVEYDAMPTAPAEPTKTGDVQYSYTFAGWSPEVVIVTGDATYKATYTQSVNKYTVKFVNNGDVIKEEELEYGTVPVAPTNVTMAPDAQYTYTFAGWDKTVVAVTGDVTYKATYTGKLNQYTVTFKNEDGTVLQSGKLDYGATPVYNGEYPSKDSTAEFNYTFAGWKSEGMTDPVLDLPTVKGNVTYTADYISLTRSYEIKFVDYNGAQIGETQLVKFGEMPVKPAAPTRESTAQYSYEFAGWSPEVEAVAGEATYTATYTETVNEYTITFRNEDGTVLQSGKLKYGSTPKYNGETPTKAPVDGVEYAFSGWTVTQGSDDVIALPTVTGNASYYAAYIATNIELEVTIIAEDGTSTTTKVNYGTYASELTFPGAQTKEQDAQYTYAFVGWNIIDGSETALNLAEYKITANTTFYPAYSKTVRSYTITFYNEDGVTVLETLTVPYGTVPSATAPTKAATDEYTYTFAGWTPEVVAVTGATSYKATFTAEINKYTITFVDYDDAPLKTEVVEYGKMPTAPADPTRQADAQYTYTFAGWDNEIAEVTGDATYKATYDKTVNKYLVKFVNENGDILQEGEVEYGQTPAYTGATPTKAGNAQYSYTFKDWSPAIKAVEGIATYTATYTQSVNKYTITFVNEDGTVLQTSEWEYGTMPEYTGATPTKAATAQYTYTFNDWGVIASVTEDATYTATYTSTVNKYAVMFVNAKGEAISVKEYYYGTMLDSVILPADPTKAATAQYTYEFSGWSIDETAEEVTELSTVELTGAITLYPVFDATVNKYTIEFVNEDGNVLQTEVLEYGVMPEYNGATPTKAATAKYTYTFDDWNAEIVSVVGNATYTATYTETINKYVITFVNEDGTELQKSEWEYDATPAYTGDTPEKAATAQYTYTFDKWSPVITTVTSDATYTATYTATVNKYTITWVTGAGTYTGEWKYGATPNPTVDKVNTSKESTDSTVFTFKSWNTEVVAVGGDATYTAVYTETTRKYTITWIVDGESTTSDVEYGTMPKFEGTPKKTPTAQHEYVFTGWTPAVVEVIGEATYEAEFEAKIRSYTITWITGAGEFTGVWEYGSTPDPVVNNVDTSKPSTPEYQYTFTDSWDKEIVSVKGNATYTANYTETKRSYKVTYVVNDEVFEEQVKEWGTSFEHPSIPAKEGHDSHWNVGFMTMPTQNITVKAVYTAKKYTVIWVADGVTVYTEQVEFNTALPNKSVPAKEGHSGVWDLIPETMPAGDVTISAVYTPNNYTVSWNFSYGSGTGVSTYGVDYEVTFQVAILPTYIRVTVGGVEISEEYFSYDNTTGKLFIVGTAIIGHISISERAAEGYQNVIISVSNAVLSNNSSIVEEGQAYHTQILPADGYLLPEYVTIYINGIEIYDGFSYDSNTGRLTINAEVMTGELTISVECPVNPNYDPNSKNCDCNCHGNAFVKFFFKIITFLRKLFGMSQYQYCDCGVAHW